MELRDLSTDSAQKRRTEARLPKYQTESELPTYEDTFGQARLHGQNGPWDQRTITRTSPLDNLVDGFVSLDLEERGQKTKTYRSHRV